MQYLVAVDRSAESWRALEHALEVADGLEADVTVVHSVNPEVFSRGGSEPVTGLEDLDDRLIIENVADAEDRGSAVLEEAIDRADDMGYEVETELLYGDPVESIPAYATEYDFDGIFVGHRGRSERVGELLGSVARGLVEQADVPVTVVR